MSLAPSTRGKREFPGRAPGPAQRSLSEREDGQKNIGRTERERKIQLGCSFACGTTNRGLESGFQEVYSILIGKTNMEYKKKT